MAEDNQLQNLGEIVIFNNEDGEVRVQVDAVNETIWLNQKGIAELFGITSQSVTIHLKNIYNDGELQEVGTCKEILQVRNEGTRKVKRQIVFYNLDAIIAVGYRVNSKRATAFRIWATKILREYMVKGFALDDDRFKRGRSLDHFKELLERIREIRISERVFYQQVKDIYALSEDYDALDEHTIEFFKKIQNKLLWAVSKKTAAELIYYRSNAELPMMGLTSTEINGIIRSTDVIVGKNYLKEDELGALKLIVEQYLSFAEAQAQAHRPMYMKDWEESLDLILKMNKRELLQNAGSLRMELAKRKAKDELARYKEIKRHEEKIESLKELEKDLRALKDNTPKP